MGNWINIKDETPTIDDCGTEFLCVVKEYNHFIKLEIAEWFNPLLKGEEPFDEHEMPDFSIEYKAVQQQQVPREVTHWMKLPNPPV